MTQWKFADPPNVAVFTTRKVVSGEDWIALVTHDADDGAWQFLSTQSEPLTETDGRVVGLSEIVQLDASVTELADLPLGWYAWRTSKCSPWQRAAREGA
jgi:hypothetical protein